MIMMSMKSLKCLKLTNRICCLIGLVLIDTTDIKCLASFCISDFHPEEITLERFAQDE